MVDSLWVVSGVDQIRLITCRIFFTLKAIALLKTLVLQQAFKNELYLKDQLWVQKNKTFFLRNHTTKTFLSLEEHSKEHMSSLEQEYSLKKKSCSNKTVHFDSGSLVTKHYFRIGTQFGLKLNMRSIYHSLSFRFEIRSASERDWNAIEKIHERIREADRNGIYTLQLKTSRSDSLVDENKRCGNNWIWFALVLISIGCGSELFEPCVWVWNSKNLFIFSYESMDTSLGIKTDWVDSKYIVASALIESFSLILTVAQSS